VATLALDYRAKVITGEKFKAGAAVIEVDRAGP
jgi:hypothetical protein